MKNNTFLYFLIVIVIFFIIFLNIYSFHGDKIILDNNINIIDIFSLIINSALILAIPTLITKSIEDNNGIKQFIIDDFKQLNSIVDRNFSLINKNLDINVDQAFREEIIDNFADAEIIFDEIEAQILASFNGKEKSLEKLKNKFADYKILLTDGEFMRANFSISYNFNEKNKITFSAFRKELKKGIHEVFKF